MLLSFSLFLTILTALYTLIAIDTTCVLAAPTTPLTDLPTSLSSPPTKPTGSSGALDTFRHPFNSLLQRHPQNATESTADDLLDGHCADVVFIFARGTSNAGNIGSTLGRLLLEAMKDKFDESIIAQGVLPYSANPLGFLIGGSRTGVKSMVLLTMRAVEQCPQAKIILGGFSQGAQVLRRTLGHLPVSIDSHIAAVLLISDSKFMKPIPGPFSSKVMSVCKGEDWVCNGKHNIFTGTHFSYIYYPFIDWIVEALQKMVKEARRADEVSIEVVPKVKKEKEEKEEKEDKEMAGGVEGE